ncbi:MAG: FecR domain-containing protein, partial [Thermoguttaceae bacterium]|nr:FecR domain-containing protein [Thermoguttaceae bacterium]
MPEEREERLDISTLVGKYVEGTLNDDEALLLAARMEHNERMVDFLLNNILSDQLLREKYKNVPLNDSTPLNMQGFGTDNSLTESTFFDSFDRQAHAADSVYFPPGTSEVAQHGHWFSFLFSRRVHHQRTSAPEIIKPRSLPKTDLFFILRVILFVSFITWLCVKEQYRSADYVSERFLPVGKVVGLADAVWAPETTFKWGQPFAAGKFKLLSGTAAIETGFGAKIVLEGPTELVVSGPMNSFCTQGKISISVPNAAHGFEVSTPQARLIDRGTEFFVRVQENESTVGVVAGLVDLQKENAP